LRPAAAANGGGSGDYNQHPLPWELTWKYNSMLTYILVSFLSGFVFFQKLCSGYG